MSHLNDWVRCHKVSPRAAAVNRCGRGLFLLLAVATGFYMLKVPNWESLPPKY